MKTKRRTRKGHSPKLENGVWVTVSSEAKYWTLLVGKVQSLAGKGAKRIAHIEFLYNLSGDRLPHPEYMDFPESRCSVDPDFKTRVIQRNPYQRFERSPDELEVEAVVDLPVAQEPPPPPVAEHRVLKNLSDL